MDVAEMKEKIYTLVESSMGKKKLKAGDIKKHFRTEGVEEELVKEGLRELIDEGRLIYTYFGGSYVEVPPKQ